MTDQPMRLGESRNAVIEYAAHLVEDAWASFDRARVSEPGISEEISALLTSPMPTAGIDPLRALDEAKAVLERSLAQSRPRFMAYVGSSGLEIGAVGDLLAHSYDVNLAMDARAASMLEDQTAAWLSEFLGYPSRAGWFTSGGTVSNISALAAARERAIPGSRRNGLAAGSAAIYCSAEAHYSVKRAAELLGIGSRSVRSVEIDPCGRGLRPDVLAAMIDDDRSRGITPIAVVGTAGTTLTGAVDPLADIAEICQAAGIWMHVDGAYGLPAAATSRRHLFTGLERADSVAVDAHKWLFVPKACSALLVRDPVAFERVFGHDEAYVPHVDHVPNSVDMTLEYSRPLRSLKLWLAFRVHGQADMRAAIEANIAQAEHCYGRARSAGTFETLPESPSLSTVPIRQRLPGCPDIDAHNSALVLALQADGGSYVSPATIDGGQWLRPCFTNFRTTLRDVDAFLRSADRIGRQLCPGH